MSSDRMFNDLATNWQLVKEGLKGRLVVEPDIDDVVFCPICLKFFTRDMISELSLEHVPPEKVGGHVRTLTCKTCNNSAGKMEAEMIKKATIEANLV
jgi:hypothetical protein